jgi:hypothetical protein
MFWLITGSLVLGGLCGAVVRLMLFVGVLIGAAAIAIAASTADMGLGGALLNALIAVVLLQVGYGIGIVLRAAFVSHHARITRADRKQVCAPPTR